MTGVQTCALPICGINDKATYKKMLRQLRNDLNEDTAKAIGQKRMPAFISYQTDAKTSVVDGSLDIGLAQWELAQEEPNWYLAGPVYPYVDKGTHLSANGYRWFGQMLGKVFHQVVVEQRGWQPLSPLHATVEGREILMDFHVPHPPLAFSEPYLGHKAQMIENYGFVITDDKGKVPVENIEAAADTVLRLVVGRDLAGIPTIRYASHATGGAGELHDSDPTVADAHYEYLPDEGMPEEANIEALVGKPAEKGALEESIRLFEEGMRLSALCQKRLDDADRKIEVLMRKPGGVAVGTEDEADILEQHEE